MSRIQSVKNQFDLHTRLFNNVLDNISDEEAAKRANEKVNHIVWLAGHITGTRNSLSDIGGFEKNEFYPDLFDHGKGIDPDGNYPSLENIKARWNEISPKISEGLSKLPEMVLSGEAPIKTPVSVSDTSMNGFLDFLMHHEAYHIGQIGILRKYLGEEAMKYN